MRLASAFALAMTLAFACAGPVIAGDDESSEGSTGNPVERAGQLDDYFRNELDMLRELHRREFERERIAAESLENVKKNRLPDPDAEVRINFDNDWFILNAAGGDWGYTSGMRTSVVWPLDFDRESLMGRWRAGEDTALRTWLLTLLDTPEGPGRPFFGVSLGQEMYTPRDLDRATVDPDDRPYAGWAYLGALFQIRGPLGRVETELQIGGTGRYSGAEQGQKAIHENTDAPNPKGWDHQISDGVGINGFLRPSRLIFNLQHPREIGVPVQLGDAQLYAETAIGTLFTAQSVGVSIRLGWIKENWVRRLEPGQYVPDRKIPHRFEPDGIELFQLYFFSRLQSQYVLRNGRIQGLPWVESEHTLAINPIVHEGEFGLYFQPVNAVAFIFASTHRTQETRNGVSDSAGHSYGHLQLVVYWY